MHQDESLVVKLSQLFKAVGDPTRLKILWLLFDKPMKVGEMAGLLDLTVSAVSHQVAILRERGLVKTTRLGKEAYCQLADAHVATLFRVGLEHAQHQPKAPENPAADAREFWDGIENDKAFKQDRAFLAGEQTAGSGEGE